MTLTTLADMRELVERHLPAECREPETWCHVADRMNEAARGDDINDAVIALRLVLQRVPCLPQWGGTLNVRNDPNYWQNRAEEAWAQAEQMTDAHTKAPMVGFAQSYEKVAKWFKDTREPR
jgi:hypothetical protein